MKKLIYMIGRVFNTWLDDLHQAVSIMSDRSGFRPAGCNNILALLLHLCDMDEAMRMWILRWIAYQVRNPGTKMTTALVINGRNCGKAVFFDEVLGQMFGMHARAITAEQLHDRMTRWAAPPANLIVAHGVLNARHAARLRAFVNAEEVIVERQGTAPTTCRNHLNFVFLSDGCDFLPEAMNSRRFVVLEAPPAWPGSYYDAVREELNNGGVTAFLDYLMLGLDLGDFNEGTRPPKQQIHKRKEAA